MKPVSDRRRFSYMRTLEDSFVPMNKEVVICVDWWGDRGIQTIRSTLARLSIRPMKYDLSYQGISIRFRNPNDAAIFMMFFEGETTVIPDKYKHRPKRTNV